MYNIKTRNGSGKSEETRTDHFDGCSFAAGGKQAVFQPCSLLSNFAAIKIEVHVGRLSTLC